MMIFLLVLHRKETYPGEYRPEVVSVVDEVTLEENPAWWVDEIAKQKAVIGDDAERWTVITASMPDNALMAALYPRPEPIMLEIQS